MRTLLFFLLVCLSTTFDLKSQDTYVANKWSLGMFLGFENSNFTKPISDIFTSSNGLNYGFQFDKREKVRFQIGGTIGANRVKKAFISPQKDIEILGNQKSNFTIIDLSVGKIYKNGKNVLVPMVGLTVNEFTLRRENEMGGILTGYSPALGLEYCYNFKETISPSAYSNIKGEKAKFFIKARHMINLNSFEKGFNGLVFSTKLVVGFDARFIKKVSSSQIASL